MDEKTLTAVSRSLALHQIRIIALLLLLERQNQTVTIREDFQRLVNEWLNWWGERGERGWTESETKSAKGLSSKILKGWVCRDVSAR